MTKAFLNFFRNIPGWSTRRKLVIIESDDWGSIRMPSLKAFQKLQQAGIDLTSADAERFNRNDTIESSYDLDSLFEVLDKCKSATGAKPVFTAVCVMANPDFARIQEDHFTEYYYESMTDTLCRYTSDSKAFESYKTGIKHKLFIPQLHGREHLNIAQWMNALRQKDSEAMLAFSEEVTGIVPKSYPRIDFQAAFLPTNLDELKLHEEILADSIRLFESIFGYKAEYFVPPNGSFRNSLNKVLVENGIKFRSTSKLQLEPDGNGGYNRSLHWLGQKDKYGLRYITRNCIFEPSQLGQASVYSCLNDIDVAFKCNKPAIISTHRVNYIGGLQPQNRISGLSLLSELLMSINKKWQNVEYLTTVELGEIIEDEVRCR